ncbi:fused response regulator/phosphatase [Salicola sp. Rm-C-2C1-2]|uniref:ATP-binding SpoIIE family protein phosphatase n=1 Tax=Salicola sp. Rm-C-2C1-2 TaxID=3141321 RepID=UPI0032E4D164
MTTDSSATIPLRILIADDNQSDRMILKAILTRHGHEVIMAEDGVQAVAAFEQQRPQMVLLDVLMPNMDGLEAARLIKAAAGEDLVPIIFLTSLSDAESLASCLEVGGDDFLTKPYNRVILRAKIHAFQRMRDLHQSLQDERDRTDQRNRQMMREQALARRVFDNIAGRGCLEADNVRFEASPMSIFNGDVLFASPKPSGGMHLFVGDFTGHGLPAAIGALPMSEIFYGMTAKGFAISDILREMNRKLQNILPTGFFCCAAMIDLNLRSGDAEVWNGGLPTAWILRHDGTQDELPSRHLPLGILPGERFSAACERHKLALGEHMLLATDGVIESSNGEGEMFGEERAVAAIGQRRAPDEGFDCLRDAAHWFGEGVVSEDDITILDVAMVQESALGALEHEVLPDTGTGPEQWRLQYDLRDRSLAEFNPVPLLLHVCMDVPGLRLFSGDVYTVITELFSNALEHGVLRLPSGLKDSPSGFSRYYSERERLLGQLDSGWVSITLEHQAHGDDGGGTLLVTVADSGPGFEFREGASSLNHEQLSGRGIALVQALCHDVRWNQNGNCVEAKYTWRSG